MLVNIGTTCLGKRQVAYSLDTKTKCKTFLDSESNIAYLGNLLVCSVLG